MSVLSIKVPIWKSLETYLMILVSFCTRMIDYVNDSNIVRQQDSQI